MESLLEMNTNQRVSKVVLAYSGGLDTSVAIKWDTPRDISPKNLVNDLEYSNPQVYGEQ